MSLLYPFSDTFKGDFIPIITKAFDAQQGTHLDPQGFLIMLTVPVNEKDDLGLVMATKRTDGFLKFRLRVKEYSSFTRVGEFSLKHEMNFSSSLFELFWESELILDKLKFLELLKATQSDLYRRWLGADHIIRLEDGGKLMTEYNSFVKHQL